MPMKDYLEIVNQIYIYLAITSNLDFNRNERHDINAFFIGKHQELLIGLDYNDLIKSYIVDFTTENVFIDAKLKKLRERYNTNEGDIIFEKYHSNYDNDNLLNEKIRGNKPDFVIKYVDESLIGKNIFEICFGEVSGSPFDEDNDKVSDDKNKL
ncbi:7866_t:CDS:2, partial [Entrophospora sp. SA101]